MVRRSTNRSLVEMVGELPPLGIAQTNNDDQGGAGQGEGADTDTSEVEAQQTWAQKFGKLPPATRKAYLAFQWAESKAGKSLQDREAYDLLKEEGIPEDAGNAGELTHYELPSFDTWARHLRNARAPLGEQKNTPRRGRPMGKSIVRADEVERQKLDDE